MTALELEDIQGIILRSYGTKKEAQFVFLTINNMEGAKKWIASVIDEITPVSHERSPVYFNLAFTYAGIKALGFSEGVLSSFPNEFTDGPLSQHKLRMLGDTRINAPENWYWGQPKTAGNIHMLVMIYANTQEILQEELAKYEKTWADARISIYRHFETKLHTDSKEHFGYRDGISQPDVEGYRPPKGHGYEAQSLVKAGEFVLGYKNEYAVYPNSPMIEDNTTNLLDKSPLDETKKDLGKNGSFLAFRQLEENVQGFWNFVKQAAEEHYGEASIDNMELVGAKMFGRWTNGAPITIHDKIPDEKENEDNDFFYAAHDFDGMKCPVGAHARRANPRDAFNDKPANSMALNKKHRLIRRARPYGVPLAPSMQLKDIIASDITNTERGIYFIAFNANYGRQFEFMQQAWIANPKFENFNGDPDPLMGSSEMAHDGQTQYFTIPEKPVRRRIAGVQTFVTTKGSAYFFMPGIKALKYIAGLKD